MLSSIIKILLNEFESLLVKLFRFLSKMQSLSSVLIRLCINIFLNKIATIGRGLACFAGFGRF
jgi:hypothetical protein